MNKFPYQITNIHTNTRKPGVIYATIVDDKNQLCANATLDYCVKWIKDAHEKSEQDVHPGFGSDADPEQDYEGENTFGPD